MECLGIEVFVMDTIGNVADSVSAGSLPPILGRGADWLVVYVVP